MPPNSCQVFMHVSYHVLLIQKSMLNGSFGY